MISIVMFPSVEYIGGIYFLNVTRKHLISLWVVNKFLLSLYIRTKTVCQFFISIYYAALCKHTIVKVTEMSNLLYLPTAFDNEITV